MGIEDFKRWHWIAIGLVVGAILAYTRLQMSPDESSVFRRGISAGELLRDLQRPKTPKGYPWVRDVTIYPPIENKNFVTGLNLEIQPDGKGIYKPFQLMADIPFKLAGGAAAPSKTFTIRDYIDQLRKGHPEAAYQFAWWYLPWAIILLWGGGALLLIGGVWPVVVNVMIGAGLGRNKEKEPEYDLDRFKGGAETATAPSGRAAPTAADHKQLKELEESLQRNIAASAARGDHSTTVAASATPTAPVRKLDGGPVELTAEQRREQEAREYKGEFYPVAKPAGHPEESKH